LLKDRWRTEQAPSTPLPAQPANGGPAAKPQPQTRASNGLDQFFSSIQGVHNLSILDFAGASQANVGFITALGHRIYSHDALRGLEEAFGGAEDFVANQSDPQRASLFLRESLDFPDQSLDGALLWDTLQFLTPTLLQETVDRLFRILRPQSSLLAFFHAEEKTTTAPLYTYRIVDPRIMSWTPRGGNRPAQYFNNRNLEKLFQKFHAVKFFLTRDHLREIIVRR
jgi:hypothetical protein